MNRRAFLKLLGITPLAPLLAKLPVFPEIVEEPEVFARVEEDGAITTSTSAFEDEASRVYVDSGNTQEFHLSDQEARTISTSVERDVYQVDATDQRAYVYGRSRGSLDVTIATDSQLFEYVNYQGLDACTIVAKMNGYGYRFVDCYPVSWSRRGSRVAASFVFDHAEITQ